MQVLSARRDTKILWKVSDFSDTNLEGLLGGSRISSDFEMDVFRKREKEGYFK